MPDKYPYLNKGFRELQDSHSLEYEAELWDSFRSGNRESLNAIFDRYVRHLYAYGRNMTRDQELIADCIQDIFFELWVKRESLTPRVNCIKHYLISSVRRRILRRLSVERRLGGATIPEDYCDEPDFNIESSMIREQTSHQLCQLLKISIETLSKAQREAIYLKFYESMSYEEIAVVMNTNVKAVYNLIARSLATLRGFFKAHPTVTG